MDDQASRTMYIGLSKIIYSVLMKEQLTQSGPFIVGLVFYIKIKCRISADLSLKTTELVCMRNTLLFLMVK